MAENRSRFFKALLFLNIVFEHYFFLLFLLSQKWKYHGKPQKITFGYPRPQNGLVQDILDLWKCSRQKILNSAGLLVDANPIGTSYLAKFQKRAVTNLKNYLTKNDENLWKPNERFHSKRANISDRYNDWKFVAIFG